MLLLNDKSESSSLILNLWEVSQMQSDHTKQDRDAGQ